MVRTIVSTAVSLALVLQLIAKSDPVRTVIPIQKIGNLLLAKATVNGKTGNFIIDTGAPTLYLNAKHYKGKSFSEVQVSSVHGKVQEIGLMQANLNLGGIERKLPAKVIDLSKVEAAKQVEILGLLGHSIFKQYELVLNLVQLQIELIQLDKKGDPLYTHPQAPTDIIPVETKGHFPVVEAEVGGVTLKLGLDTGAEYNLVADRYQTRILNSAYNVSTAALTSGGQKVGQKQVGRVKGWRFNGIPLYPMMTVFAGMPEINRSTGGINLDGLLGVEFLVQYKMAINFKKRRLLIWDHRNSASTPLVAREGSN